MLKNVLQISTIVGVLSDLTSGRWQEDTHISPAKGAVNVLQDKVSANSLNTLVMGYDFNSNEMENLKLWDRGTVLYYIDIVSYDKVLRDRIRTFLDVTNGLSGLQFLELPSPPVDLKTRWVFFVNRRGLLDCADHSIKNFTTEGVQQVILGYDCLTNKGELAEVVLALAGVPPQHNAPNRDKYITVHFDKILPEKRYLFEKVKDSEWLFHDLEYDFSSASHFNFHKHTIDGSATIDPKIPVDVFVGEENGFSFTDILKTRRLYNYIRKPNVDELESNCKKLFKSGANLKLYFPREKLMKNVNFPQKKPEKYRLSNADYVENSRAVSSDDGESDDEDQEENKNANVKHNEKLYAKKQTPKNYDEINSVKPSDDIKRDYTKTLLLNYKPSKSTKTSKTIDPLSYLSDYNTDDDAKKRYKRSIVLEI